MAEEQRLPLSFILVGLSKNLVVNLHLVMKGAQESFSLKLSTGIIQKKLLTLMKYNPVDMTATQWRAVSSLALLHHLLITAISHGLGGEGVQETPLMTQISAIKVFRKTVKKL